MHKTGGDIALAALAEGSVARGVAKALALIAILLATGTNSVIGVGDFRQSTPIVSFSHDIGVASNPLGGARFGPMNDDFDACSVQPRAAVPPP